MNEQIEAFEAQIGALEEQLKTAKKNHEERVEERKVINQRINALVAECKAMVPCG